MADTVLQADCLTKRYGARAAVNGLSFDVRRGTITGFLGENGAGKTTTLRMFLGLVKPTSGSAVVCGVDVGRGHKLPAGKVGALIENPSAWPWLSADDMLRVCATTSGRIGKNVDAPRRRALLARVGLSGRERDLVGGFSLGMKQRLGLAVALLTDPEVLILDEPMNGLDPRGVTEMRELLSALRDEGRTLLVSSHQLGEMQQMCDDVVIVSRGQRRYAGPMQGLAGTERLRLRVSDATATAALLGAIGVVAIADGVDGIMTIEIAHARAPEVAAAVVGARIGLFALEPIGLDLERAFLATIDDHATPPGAVS